MRPPRPIDEVLQHFRMMKLSQLRNKLSRLRERDVTVYRVISNLVRPVKPRTPKPFRNKHHEP